MVSMRKDLHAGERMKTIRQSRHLTQDQLARAAGVSRSLVAQWETGRSGFAGKAVEIAKVLEIPVKLLKAEYQTGPLKGREVSAIESHDEQILLDAFREMATDDQACVLHMVRRLATAP
jgi:transcriptional regulator with XRE-family HTH domain